jgi:glycosyltransferase involved in cell wall biosynthesis
LRLLLVSRAYPPAVGGMERFAEQLGEWFSARGHEVTVVTQTAAEPDADRDRPYRVMREPSWGVLGRVFREAEAVQVNGLSSRAVAAAVATGRRPVTTHAGHQAICPTGLAWSERGSCGAGPGRGPCGACPSRGPVGVVGVALHRGAARVSRSNVCVSRYLDRRLALPRSAVIYNPVPEKALASRTLTAGEDGLIAFAGRLVAEKGLHILLRSLPRLPDARLEVAGDGPLRSSAERLAATLRVADRVRFRGALPFQGIAELYARASVVCVPSAWDEPFGYVAAEAMAMGRPVVGTPSGALPELLKGGRGYLAGGPDPPALARALEAALGDPRSRREAGERAANFAHRELSPEVIGPRYEALYREAAG